MFFLALLITGIVFGVVAILISLVCAIKEDCVVWLWRFFLTVAVICLLIVSIYASWQAI